MTASCGRMNFALALRCGVSLLAVVSLAPAQAQTDPQVVAAQQSPATGQAPAGPTGEAVQPASSTGDIQTSATAQNVQTDTQTFE